MTSRFRNASYALCLTAVLALTLSQGNDSTSPNGNCHTRTRTCYVRQRK